MRCHGFLAAIVTGWAAAEQLSLEIHVAGRYRPLHFSRGDDYEAVARAWLEALRTIVAGSRVADSVHAFTLGPILVDVEIQSTEKHWHQS